MGVGRHQLMSLHQIGEEEPFVTGVKAASPF